MLSLYVRALNGLVTILFVPLLLNIYRKRNKQTYLYWAVGFALYGLNILLRTALLYYGIDSYLFQLVTFVLFSFGFMFFLTGIGVLINKVRPLLIISLSIPATMILLYLTVQSYQMAQFISMFPFLIMCAASIYIRFNYPVEFDLFVVGWLMLLLTNVGLVYNLASDVLIDSVAIIAKFVIFYGMINPKFGLLADDFENFLLSGNISTYLADPSWHLTLVESQVPKAQELAWIKEVVNKNSVAGIRTVFVSIYDIISIGDLKARGILDLDNLYVIRMYHKGKIFKSPFSEQVMTINDNISELDILFNDLIEFTSEKKRRCQVILYPLSSLIHIHGHKRLYSMLISKISALKESELQVYLVYHPLTHADDYPSDLFRVIMDEIIQLK